MATPVFANRVPELLGADIPIEQAPMGWIARSQLAGAVSNAGAMGIIETLSGELDIIRDEIWAMRQRTDKPFGVNIARATARGLGPGSSRCDAGHGERVRSDGRHTIQG